MFIKTLLLRASATLLAGALTGHAATFTLADYAVRIDGLAAFPTRGEPLPGGVNVSGFDASTGLGTLLINVRSPGPHVVALFVDHEIDQTTNTFFNEFGARSGSPPPGQAWELDEPGYRFGNLFTNFLAGRLDNSNAVSAAARDDVAMALSWNFTLGPNQTALVEMTLSETPPTNSFYLSQTDPQSQRTIFSPARWKSAPATRSRRSSRVRRTSSSGRTPAPA